VWLRKQLKAKAAEELFAAMDRMPPWTILRICRLKKLPRRLGDACGAARQGLRLMRLVLDTNVVVSAFCGWRAKRLLKACHSEGILIFTSTPLLEELTETLSKSKLERKIAASMLSADQLVNSYAEWVSVYGRYSCRASRPIRMTMWSSAQRLRQSRLRRYRR